MVTVSVIRSRTRDAGSLGYPNLANDFVLQEVGTVDRTTFLSNRGISLYSIDHKKRLAFYVEIPEETDITAAPFLYLAQFKHATRVLAVPFQEMFEVADKVPVDFGDTVLIYSVGRCGSTLLSKIFHAAEGVLSLSEPEVYSEITQLLTNEEIDVELARKLIRVSTALLIPSLFGTNTTVRAIKFRAELTTSHQVIQAALPGSRPLFMYRNAVDVIRSMLRFTGTTAKNSRFKYGRLVRIPLLAILLRRMMLRTIRLGKLQPSPTHAEILKSETNRAIFLEYGEPALHWMQWLLIVHSYKELLQQHPEAIALRYEDLVANPIGMVKLLFEYCGIKEQDYRAVCDVLSIDSQRGTRGSAFTKGDFDPLDDRDLHAIGYLFRRYSDLPGPDAVLPNTIAG